MPTDLQTAGNPVIEVQAGEQRGIRPNAKVKLAGFLVIVVAGLARAWIGRYSISPDGMCYLDLGDAFFRRKWFDVVNGYWSPLYAWLLGAALSLTKPSPRWEFPVAHLVNLLIYLAAFACFEFFLRSLLQQRRGENHSGYDEHAINEMYLVAIGYSLFLWTSLELITIWDLSPDLLLAAFVYLIAGLLLRIRSKSSIVLYLAFGTALGFAYLTKAVMFPLGLAFILIGLFCVPRRRQPQYMVLVVISFMAISAPWLIALSHAKGRVNFGDSGRLAYSALVSPGGRLLNWQGDPPGSGVPVHTTRKIHDNPPVYEFATPVGGTYPPSYDPSYWNEGRKWTFDARTQLRVVRDHLFLYSGLLLRSQSGLLAGVIAFLLAGGAATRKQIARNWFLFAMFVGAAGLYSLVHAESRFIGAYLTIFWIAILSGVRLWERAEHKMAEYVAAAIVVTILLSVADGTTRSILAGGPYSARDRIAVSDGLERLGLHPDDRIAVFGDGNWSYWARLAKLKIVSTIVLQDTPAFWSETPDQKQEVYRLLSGTGAKAVITAQLPATDVGDEWKPVGATGYHVRWLTLSGGAGKPSAPRH